MAETDDWTYTPGSTKLKDKIRFLIGDTNESRRLILDGDITMALVLGSNNLFRSAAYACDAIAAKHARDQQHSVQGVSVTQEAAYMHYKRLAKEYRQKSASVGSVFVVNMRDQKTDFITDTDLIPPAIIRGIYSFQRNRDRDDRFLSESC